VNLIIETINDKLLFLIKEDNIYYAHTFFKVSNGFRLKRKSFLLDVSRIKRILFKVNSSDFENAEKIMNNKILLGSKVRFEYKPYLNADGNIEFKKGPSDVCKIVQIVSEGKVTVESPVAGSDKIYKFDWNISKIVEKIETNSKNFKINTKRDF
jgi:hypothetical protein